MPDTLAGLLTQDDQVTTTDPASGLAKVLAWLTGPEGGLSNAMGMKPWYEQSPMDIGQGFGGGAIRNVGRGAIRAFHGSPHDFDKFDMSKIGTGEGAQAYGHGLYFAENEGVARGYRDALAPSATKWTYDGRELSGAEQNAANLLDQRGSVGSVLDYIKHALRPGRMADQNYLDETERLVRQMDPAKVKIVQDPGRMYEVDINADPARLLDWDKPLALQSESVSKGLENAGGAASYIGDSGMHLGDFIQRAGRNRYTAADLFNRGGDPLEMTDAAVSARLREAGIPGIRYLDQGSRNIAPIRSINDAPLDMSNPSHIAANALQDARGDRATALIRLMNIGSGTADDALRLIKSGVDLPRIAETAAPGTSNYVMFDDKLIDIIRKYGLAGLITSGAATMGSDEGMTP